jgi:hypothetical protein
MAHYNQSKYKPTYPQKYKGDPTNIICRSSWERKFCIYCDRNENILEWGSEEIVMPYRSPVDGRVHRYFPDFYIKVKESTGRIKKMIIEIKPKRQCSPPSKPKKQTKGYLREAYEYAKNQAKWEAASEWCKDRGYIFKVFTEKELGIK